MKKRAPTAMGQRRVLGIVETFHETSLRGKFDNTESIPQKL